MNFRKTILHLEEDVLRAILLLVAASAGGATDIANTIAVCQVFALLSDDKDLLKMVNFENLVVSESIGDWLHNKGLLIRCAEAGNSGAKYLLAKAILIGYSQLLDQESNYNKRLSSGSVAGEASSSRVGEADMLPSFLSYFRPGQKINNNSNTSKFTHFEIVSSFLWQCNIMDHVSMLPHVFKYVNHFGLKNKGYKKFLKNIDRMSIVLLAIVDVGRKRRTRYSLRLLNNGRIEPEMRNAWDVLQSLATKLEYYSDGRVVFLSQPKYEEMKRDSHFISSVCGRPLESGFTSHDLGKRFFYYLAFNGPITGEVEIPLNHNMTHLQEASIQCATYYCESRLVAALAFDRMFVRQMPF